MRHGSYNGRRNNNNNNNNNNRHRNNNGGQNRSNNSGSGQRPHRNQVLDSNGPEARVRGTAFQINEKYLSLAKDASSIGDLILAENYLQHAEHYQRMINEFEQSDPRPQQHQNRSENNEGTDEQSSEASSEEYNNTDNQSRNNNPNPKAQRAPVQDLSQNDGEAAPAATSDEGVKVVRKTRIRKAKEQTPSEDDDTDLGLPSSIFNG